MAIKRHRFLESEEVKAGARHDFTDAGNARRFAEDHDGRLIYAVGPGWHRWNGRRWRPITRDEALREAKQTARRIRREAAAIDDSEVAIKTLKWQRSSSSASKLSNMIQLAQGGEPDGPELVLSVKRLDGEADMLNTPVGIVDLRNGALHESDPERYFTLVTNSNHDEEADQRAWQAFLRQVIPDRQIRRAFQIAVGASITGHVPKAIFVLHGPRGDNGKTTIIEALNRVLGRYATVAMETTFTNAGAREAGYDLAELRGVRFVSFSETREARGLAAERVKRLTGGDTVKARTPYGKPFTYEPQFSLWVPTNYQPVIPSGDTALWKRIWVFPFDVQIPRCEQVNDFGATLARKHGGAILAWAIEGARLWYADECRLPPQPLKMRQRLDSWRERDDLVGRWIVEHTEPASVNARVKNSDLYRDFRDWYADNGEAGNGLPLLTARQFHQEFREHKLTLERGYQPNAGTLDGSETVAKIQMK